MAVEKILVPTDFSENGGWAIDHAIGLASAVGARIDLVHSIYVPNVYDVVTPIDLEQQIRDVATRRLLTQLERIRGAGIDGEMHLVEEAAPVAIQGLAEKLGTDLVVMGTRGLTGLQHVLLGSTAERTLRIAPCPVLTVSAPPAADTPRPRRILVPTDFSDTSDAAIDLAADLIAGVEGAEIVLAHVYARPVAAGPYAYAAANDFVELKERVASALDEVAQALVDRGITTSAHVSEALSAPKEIARVAEEQDVDWIVIGTHGRTGLSHLALGSIAERVVRAAVRPTLTIRHRRD